MTMPSEIKDFKYLAHLLLSIPHFEEISFSRVAPVAMASIIPLYVDGSRSSCFKRFDGSSYKYPDDVKNKLMIFSFTDMEGLILARYSGIPPVIPKSTALSVLANGLKKLNG